MAAPAEQQPQRLEQEQNPENRAEQLEALSSAEIAERIHEMANEVMENSNLRIMAYEQAVANLGEQLPDSARMEITGLFESELRPPLERLQMILEVIRSETGVQMESRNEDRPDNVMELPGSQRVEVVEQPMQQETEPAATQQMADLDVSFPTDATPTDQAAPQAADVTGAAVSSQIDTVNQQPVADVLPPDQVPQAEDGKDENNDDGTQRHQQAGPSISIAA